MMARDSKAAEAAARREDSTCHIPVAVIRDGSAVPLLPVDSTLSSGRIAWDGLTLNSFRDIPACQIPDHEHPNHLMTLVTHGSTKVHWAAHGRRGRVEWHPGQLNLLPAGTHDRVEFDQPTNRVILTLEPRAIATVFDETAHQPGIEIVERWLLDDRRIASLILALQADLEDGSPAGRLYGESLGVAIAVWLSRRYGVPTHEPKQYRGGLPGYRLRLVLDYIGTHLDRDVRLSDMAALAGMSPHYFAELFRQSMGQSPHQYVLAQRIDRAKRLLRNRTLSILDIAILLGFANAGHFSRVFRRITGATPSLYRADL